VRKRHGPPLAADAVAKAALVPPLPTIKPVTNWTKLGQFPRRIKLGGATGKRFTSGGVIARRQEQEEDLSTIRRFRCQIEPDAALARLPRPDVSRRPKGELAPCPLAARFHPLDHYRCSFTGSILWDKFPTDGFSPGWLGRDDRQETRLEQTAEEIRKETGTKATAILATSRSKPAAPRRVPSALGSGNGHAEAGSRLPGGWTSGARGAG